MGYPIVEPDSEPEASKSMESEASSEMTLEDSLRRLRQKRYQQGSQSWAPQSEERPSEPSSASGDTTEEEPVAEETSTEPVEFNAAAQLSDDLEPAPSQPAETAGSKQAAFADKAFQQTTIVLEQVAAGIEGLSGEVRRVGRELFKTARAAERNQDLFDSAIAELRQLTQRVEQVPAQLRGSESIVEVKAALCREMLGVADALEASLIAAQMRLEQLQERVESARVEGRAGSSEIARSLPQRLFRRWGFQRERSSQQAPRAPSPRTGRVDDGGAPRDMLDEAVATLDQWLDGQRLLYERLQIVLQSAGVRRIESEGQSFDPSRHRAVSTEARDDVPAGTIVGEEMRGYTLDGRILRYAEVIVAKNEQDSRH